MEMNRATCVLETHSVNKYVHAWDNGTTKWDMWSMAGGWTQSGYWNFSKYPGTEIALPNCVSLILTKYTNRKKNTNNKLVGFVPHIVSQLTGDKMYVYGCGHFLKLVKVYDCASHRYGAC